MIPSVYTCSDIISVNNSESSNTSLTDYMELCINDNNCIGIGKEKNNSKCFKLYNGKIFLFLSSKL